MISDSELATRIHGALLAARERVLQAVVTTGELIAESRGALDQHIAIEIDREGDDMLVIRTKAITPHGARIVSELEKATIAPPAA